MRIRIYYEDTDCGGILYHTNYIKYCERARSELFFSRAMLPQEANAGFVVSDLQAKFLGFARLGDMCEVRSQILKIGKVQILLLQEIYKLPNVTVLDFANQSNLRTNDKTFASDKTSANISPKPEQTFDKKLDKNIDEEKIFSAQVRLGYVDVASQKPVAIPKHLEKIFLELGDGGF